MRAKINWFNSINDLLLEGIVDVCVLAPFAKELGVLANDLAEGSGGGTGGDDGLSARVDDDGKWLARGNCVVHGCGHDSAQIPVGASSTVGWDGGGVLFQLVAKASECVIRWLAG